LADRFLALQVLIVVPTTDPFAYCGQRVQQGAGNSLANDKNSQVSATRNANATKKGSRSTDYFMYSAWPAVSRSIHPRLVSKVRVHLSAQLDFVGDHWQVHDQARCRGALARSVRNVMQ